MFRCTKMRASLFVTFCLCTVPCLSAFSVSISGNMPKAIRLSGVAMPLATRRYCEVSTGPLGHTRRRAMKMIQSSSESSDADCLVLPRSKMVDAFRSFFKDAGVDESGAPMSLSMKQISLALSKLGYSQQEIECVFKQIDKNGCTCISAGFLMFRRLTLKFTIDRQAMGG
jgi:hypothetical protein